MGSTGSPKRSGSSGVAGTAGWSTIVLTRKWWIAVRTAQSVNNDPAFFLGELTKVFARHPNWIMPKNQLNGTAPAVPQRDGLSDLRVAFFLRLLPGSSMVEMAFANNHSTCVPTIDGGEVVKLTKELTITERWTRGLAAHYGWGGRVEVFLQHRFGFRILTAQRQCHPRLPTT